MALELENYIRTIPDYPKPGILFRDITTLLAAPDAFGETIARLSEPFREADVSYVVGIEARGFTIGGAIAVALGAGFVPIRKAGKLPADTVSQEYELEYGTDTIEMHTDAIRPGSRVLLVDDLIATGGTAAAAISLLRRVEADIVATAFIIDLPDLGGMAKIRELDVEASALLEYPGH